MYLQLSLDALILKGNANPWLLAYNKKLRDREEHSASVALSWCTLWHFSGENLLMANQPLLRNVYRTTEFGEITQNKSHYAVQGHSRSQILVPIESPYTTSY